MCRRDCKSKISSNLSDQIDRINRIVSQGRRDDGERHCRFPFVTAGRVEGQADQAIVGQYLAELEKRVGPNTAAKINEAAGASNIAKTSGEIEGWAANPSEAPKAVKSALEDNPQFYRSQPGLFDALNAIGKKGGEPIRLFSEAARLWRLEAQSAAGLAMGHDWVSFGRQSHGGVLSRGAMTEGRCATLAVKAAGQSQCGIRCSPRSI